MAMFLNTCPLPGDTDNVLLAKIAQKLCEGGGGGDGVTSISVNGGPAQTGAVDLPMVTGITVDGGPVQTGEVALVSGGGGPVNFQDGVGAADAVVLVDNGSTEVARWVGTTGTLTTRRLNAQSTDILGVAGTSGGAPTPGEIGLLAQGGTGGDSSGFFVNAASGGAIQLTGGTGGNNVAAGNGGRGGDVVLNGGQGGTAGIFDPAGSGGNVVLNAGSSGGGGGSPGQVQLNGQVVVNGDILFNGLTNFTSALTMQAGSQIFMDSGTAGAPGLQHLLSFSGIYFPNNNELAISTNGTLRLLQTDTDLRQPLGMRFSVGAGAQQRAGNATLVAGQIAVACTSVTANSIVLLTRKTNGGTPNLNPTYTLNAGVGFTITTDGPAGADTSTFSYFVIEVV